MQCDVESWQRINKCNLGLNFIWDLQISWQKLEKFQNMIEIPNHIL